MAKMSNESKLVDALAICDRLDADENLNLSSRAIINVARSYIELNDGKFAFELATRAEGMDRYCKDQQRQQA